MRDTKKQDKRNTKRNVMTWNTNGWVNSLRKIRQIDNENNEEKNKSEILGYCRDSDESTALVGRDRVLLYTYAHIWK